MSSPATAYLLAWISTRDGPALKGFSVFSERQPTVEGRGIWAEVLSAEGPDYGAACEQLKRDITALYPEILPLIQERGP